MPRVPIKAEVAFVASNGIRGREARTYWFGADARQDCALRRVEFKIEVQGTQKHARTTSLPGLTSLYQDRD